MTDPSNNDRPPADGRRGRTRGRTAATDPSSRTPTAQLHIQLASLEHRAVQSLPGFLGILLVEKLDRPFVAVALLGRLVLHVLVRYLLIDQPAEVLGAHAGFDAPDDHFVSFVAGRVWDCGRGNGYVAWTCRCEHA